MCATAFHFNDARANKELRFVPVVASNTDNAQPTTTIYEALCKGAELNPDADDADANGEGDAVDAVHDWSSKFQEPDADEFPVDDDDDDNNNNNNNNDDDDDEVDERFADADESAKQLEKRAKMQ